MSASINQPPDPLSSNGLLTPYRSAVSELVDEADMASGPDDADRPAKWYFQLKAAHLEAKRTGSEMKHPMSGPVTLRWRS